MTRYAIEEEGDEDLGFSWNVMLIDGDRVKCVAQCMDEKFAQRFISAQKWADSVESGLLSLKMEGISIGPSGKARRAKPIDIVFTPAAKRKKT